MLYTSIYIKIKKPFILVYECVVNGKINSHGKPATMTTKYVCVYKPIVHASKYRVKNVHNNAELRSIARLITYCIYAAVAAEQPHVRIKSFVF